MSKSIKIEAMGRYLPKAVTSGEIESKFKIPAGWAEKNSGVRKRHHVTHESSGFMGARAIEDALSKSKLELKDIDLIISASATFDYPLPNQASVIKSELEGGLKEEMGTLDVDATCLSFVAGFDLASRLLDGNQYKHIVLVSAEISSKGLNPENWETCTLFGDAAVAAILSFDDTKESVLIKGGTRTYAEGVDYTIIKGGGNQFHAKDHPYNPELYSFQMSGKKLLKLAKKKLPDFVNWFFGDLDKQLEDADAIIPHQASKLGLKIFEKLYSFKAGQVRGNLHAYGNCIAASIPLLLYEQIEQNKIQRGDLVFLIGTSAGFSIGGVLFRY